MNSKPGEKEGPDLQEALFSEDSYEFSWPRPDRPRYNPRSNVLYLPSFEDELDKKVVARHEVFHKAFNKSPSLCLLQALSRLIYHEFARDKYDASSNISALLPENNPTVRMLKGFHDTILKSTKYVQEVISIHTITRISPDTRLAVSWDAKGKIDTHSLPKASPEGESEESKLAKLEQGQVKTMENKLSGFRDLYQRYSSIKSKGVLNDLPGHYLCEFPFYGPLFIPQIPVRKDGRLNEAEITDEIADNAIDKFRDTYKELPYSPLKRFLTLISIIEQMINDNAQFSRKNLIRRINNYDDFNQQTTSKLLRKKGGIRKCQHCPIETLHSRGVGIPYDDFGRPSSFFHDSDHRQSKCQKQKAVDAKQALHWPFRNCYNESRFQGIHLPALAINKRRRERLTRENGSLVKRSKKIKEITRNAFYSGNWRFSSFITGSELLRYFVFNPSKLSGIPSKLTLVEHFYNPPFREAPDRAPAWDLNSTPDLSPFISVKAISEDRLTDEDIYYRLQ